MPCCQAKPREPISVPNSELSGDFRFIRELPVLQGYTWRSDGGPSACPSQSSKRGCPSQGTSHLALLLAFSEGTRAFAACEFGVAPAELVGLLAQGDVLPLGCECVYQVVFPSKLLLGTIPHPQYLIITFSCHGK